MAKKTKKTKKAKAAKKTKKRSAKNPNEADIDEAQEQWRLAIIDIGHAFTNGKDVVACATKHINDLYGYAHGVDVLFKPTKCEQRQFRPTFEGALSYFVGHAIAPAEFPEDEGFAIAPYIDVRFANAGFIFAAGRAIAMGNYYFTKTNGQVVKVEYTFGYQAVANDLVIDVHHSSLPYKR